jgi:hypothetical protein
VSIWNSGSTFLPPLGANCLAISPWGTSPGACIQAAKLGLPLRTLDPMNHAARFLTDAETICKQIPREKIELLADGLVQLRDRGGRLFLLGVGGSAGAKYVVQTERTASRRRIRRRTPPLASQPGMDSPAAPSPSKRRCPAATRALRRSRRRIIPPLQGARSIRGSIAASSQRFGICGRHWTDGVDATTAALVAASAQKAHVA